MECDYCKDGTHEVLISKKGEDIICCPDCREKHGKVRKTRVKGTSLKINELSLVKMEKNGD